ncbi:toll/interleukin-1 receptor domain-containing protein [Ahniella affigens]|nr:toll/interleukin-1 receptor domain-containing protein [Ahniella affigens]
MIVTLCVGNAYAADRSWDAKSPWTEAEIEGLIAALGDPAESTRLNTLQMLAIDGYSYQDPRLVSKVAEALTSDDEDVRRAAISALRPAGTSASAHVNAVKEVLTGPESALLPAAVLTLGAISLAPSQDLAGVAELLKQPDVAVHDAVLQVLVAHPDAARGQAAALLSYAGRPVAAAQQAIQGQRQEHVGLVLGRLASTEPDILLPTIVAALTAASEPGTDALGMQRAGVVAALVAIEHADAFRELEPPLRAMVAPALLSQRQRLGGASEVRQLARIQQRDLEARLAVMAAAALLVMNPGDNNIRAFLNRSANGDYHDALVSALRWQTAAPDPALLRQAVLGYRMSSGQSLQAPEVQTLVTVVKANPAALAAFRPALTDTDQSVRVGALRLLGQIDLPLGPLADTLPRMAARPSAGPDDELESALATELLARNGLATSAQIDAVVAKLRHLTPDTPTLPLLTALAHTGLPTAWTAADSARLVAQTPTAERLLLAATSPNSHWTQEPVHWLKQLAALDGALAWSPGSREDALDLADALRRLGPLRGAAGLRPFLLGCIRRAERCDGLRSLAYRLFGHDRESRLLIVELSDHEDYEVRRDQWLRQQSTRDRIAAITGLLTPIADPDRTDRRLYSEAARKMLELIGQEHWTPADESALTTWRELLESVGETAYAEQIDRILRQIKGVSYLRWLGWLLLANAAFWCVVMLLYPRVRFLQSGLIWNRWVRRLLGLGYVGLLLRVVPALARRLFAPFRAALVPPGALTGFQTQSYYNRCQMRPARGRDQEPIPVESVLKTARGRVVLQGASGLGKTTLLRHLALQGDDTVMLLRALDCKEGVLRAIQSRLPVSAGDPDFLAALVQSGALILMIDGLNEASPDTRARIDHFLQSDYRGYFLLTTQPLNWEPPAQADVYDLLPLAESAIQEFLIQQWAALKSVQPDQSAYAQSVIAFIGGLQTAAGQGDELALRRLNALCNPMEAVLAAELLAKGQRPDTGRMLEQFFSLMRSDFKQIENREFPDAAFAERVYDWRLSSQAFIDVTGFEREAEFLRQHKLMRRREEEVPQRDGQRRIEAVWQFRHDRIMDYALLPAFLADHQDRQFKHWRDVRFNGVYDLLVERLPLEQARQLLSFLQDRAAESNDSALCLRLAAILREREGTLLGTIEQDYLATLEQIQHYASLDTEPGPDAHRELSARLSLQLQRTAGTPFPRRADIQQTLEALHQGRIWRALRLKRDLPAPTGDAEAPFDVFLSHNSKDKPAVRELAQALKADGLKVWYDEWELVPGRPIQEALENAMLRCRTAAVLVGADGFGPWEVPEMRGFLALAVERALPVIPVLLPGAPAKPALPLFLKQFLWVDLRSGVVGDNYDRMRWGITGIRPKTVLT